MQLQFLSHVTPFLADPTDAWPGTVSPPVPGLALSRLRIRRLRPADRMALAQHLIDLPAQDRRTRFGVQASDAAIRQHCDGLDLQATPCFALLDADGAVLGAALGFDCGVAAGAGYRRIEVAVSIAPALRRHGLGADLVARVCSAAAAKGAGEAVFEFEPGNAAIQGLARHLGGWIEPQAERCVIRFAATH